MSKKENSLVVSLDIGTSKVVAIVADPYSNNQIEILGVGMCPSTGMRKGTIVNVDATVSAIAKAIEEAEVMAGCQIHSVYAGIVGNHLRGINSQGMVAIANREITQTDVDHVIEAAKAVAIPPDQKILHILPQEFTVDNQTGITDPIGMTGVRLEVKVHIVTGAISVAQNIINSVRKCGLDVDDIVLEQLASSYSVLSNDEKHLGVCMIDIGGGTTDVAVFADGAICHTAALPVAGDQVTNDITVAFRIPVKQAEEIKIKHAVTMCDIADPEHKIEVTSVGKHGTFEINQYNLAQVIEPRYEELLYLVKEELHKIGMANSLMAGIVITGGSSKIPGLVELAEKIFGLPVRLGLPNNVLGNPEIINDPIFATGIGLLYSKKERQRTRKNYINAGVAGVFYRVKEWLQMNF
jgi:cell division protein FtsA